MIRIAKFLGSLTGFLILLNPASAQPDDHELSPSELVQADVVPKGSQSIGEMLQEAQNFFQTKKYEEAKRVAQGILKVDPKNARAKKILGLAAYNLGDYSIAFENLKELEDPEFEITPVLAVLYILR